MVSAESVGAVLSTVTEPLAVVVLERPSVAVTVKATDPAASVEPAVLEALLYP